MCRLGLAIVLLCHGTAHSSPPLRRTRKKWNVLILPRKCCKVFCAVTVKTDLCFPGGSKFRNAKKSSTLLHPWISPEEKFAGAHDCCWWQQPLKHCQSDSGHVISFVKIFHLFKRCKGEKELTGHKLTQRYAIAHSGAYIGGGALRNGYQNNVSSVWFCACVCNKIQNSHSCFYQPRQSNLVAPDEFIIYAP